MEYPGLPLSPVLATQTIKVWLYCQYWQYLPENNSNKSLCVTAIQFLDLLFYWQDNWAKFFIITNKVQMFLQKGHKDGKIDLSCKTYVWWCNVQHHKCAILKILKTEMFNKIYKKNYWYLSHEISSITLNDVVCFYPAVNRLEVWVTNYMMIASFKPIFATNWQYN